jgi:hypothetical protein
VKEFLDPIFDASNENEVCESLQAALDKLKERKYLNAFPERYKEIKAQSPIEIQKWFDKMMNDRQTDEEGNLKEVFELFRAALQQLRQHGFHREP